MTAMRTPGKVAIDPKAIGTKWNIGTAGNGQDIALAQQVTGDDDAQSIRTANAQHIAKCWNACDGIDPEAVPYLLEACKVVLDRYVNRKCRGGEMLLAAIAKAEGWDE